MKAGVVERKVHNNNSSFVSHWRKYLGAAHARTHTHTHTRRRSAIEWVQWCVGVQKGRVEKDSQRSLGVCVIGERKVKSARK
mmetsp:Transcript_11905/g.25897  ORF Transcript_11905/g.25897 Transcript_11905/m.25897 type:complete len:82 (-) Transcript_11905:735-980(-)